MELLISAVVVFVVAYIAIVLIDMIPFPAPVPLVLKIIVGLVAIIYLLRLIA